MEIPAIRTLLNTVRTSSPEDHREQRRQRSDRRPGKENTPAKTVYAPTGKLNEDSSPGLHLNITA
jgi:hypothetical protein